RLRNISGVREFQGFCALLPLLGHWRSQMRGRSDADSHMSPPSLFLWRMHVLERLHCMYRAFSRIFPEEIGTVTRISEPHVRDTQQHSKRWASASAFYTTHLEE